jgi:hypothetical protein
MLFRVNFASFTYIALVLGDPAQHDTLASRNVRSMRSLNVKPSGGIEAPLDGLVRKAKKKTSSKPEQKILSATVDAAVRSETLADKTKLNPVVDEEGDAASMEEEVAAGVNVDLEGDDNEDEDDSEGENADGPLEETKGGTEADEAALAEDEEVAALTSAWCKISGDPHTTTFDKYYWHPNKDNSKKKVKAGGNSFNHFWQVQTEDDSVLVQAMYGPCTFSATCLSGIAISGSFMNNPHGMSQTLALKSVCDWDWGTNSCTAETNNESRPRIYWNSNRLSFGHQSDIYIDPLEGMTFKVGSASAKLQRKSWASANSFFYKVTVNLPDGMILKMDFKTSHVGKGAMSAHIYMKQRGVAQCGHCGNFNGIMNDDEIYERTGLLKDDAQKGTLCDAEVHCGSRMVPASGGEECEEMKVDPTAPLPSCPGGIARVDGRCCRPPAEVLANYMNGKKNNLNALEYTAAKSCTDFAKTMHAVLHESASVSFAKSNCVDDMCEGWPAEMADFDLAEAQDACLVTLYEHWPVGMTKAKAKALYKASGKTSWKDLWKTWKESYPTGNKFKVYVAEDQEKHISLANFTKTSSVKVESLIAGECCTVHSYANSVLHSDTGKCQGDPTGAGMNAATNVLTDDAFGIGLVTPRENLEKAEYLGCNDATCGCLKIEQGNC